MKVSDTTTIKAIAIKDGMTDSQVTTATYTIKKAEPKPEKI
ncbi:MAG: chitobiase/beta-hexosaminidase C-terminal domain-containing protein, partial [Prevotella sp.]|nr:chitobiase/beta-hexosaminidase C-terminal domain-containing protein [Prevotella sp.]